MGYDPGLRCMGLDISFVYGLEYSLKKKSLIKWVLFDYSLKKKDHHV